MRQLITASVIVGCMGVVAGAQQLKVPAGCHASTGAKESFEGYAEKIIHDKTAME